jgi:hypothetical protein
MRTLLLSLLGFSGVWGVSVISEVSASSYHHSHHCGLQHPCHTVSRPTITYYYHPRPIIQTAQNDCRFCGTENTSRTLFRDRLTPYEQKTTYYQSGPQIFRNYNPQPFSCPYRNGR